MPTQDAEARLPVRWSDQLKLSSLGEIEAKLQAKGTTIFGELSLGDKSIVPKSCAEWATLHAEGYRPSTTLEEQPDGAAKRECKTLMLLHHAKPAQRSFVRNLAFDKTVLRVLPAAVATSVSREQQQSAAEATDRGRSLAELDPKARVGKSPLPGVLTILEGGAQSSVSVEPMAWADFNGDGVDDLLVTVSNQMLRGSVSETRVLVLTRGADGEVLRQVDVTHP